MRSAHTNNRILNVNKHLFSSSYRSLIVLLTVHVSNSEITVHSEIPFYDNLFHKWYKWSILSVDSVTDFGILC